MLPIFILFMLWVSLRSSHPCTWSCFPFSLLLPSPSQVPPSFSFLTGSHYVTLAVLDFSMYTRLTSSSPTSSYLHFLVPKLKTCTIVPRGFISYMYTTKLWSYSARFSIQLPQYSRTLLSQCHVFFCDNPLNPINAVHVCLGMGPCTQRMRNLLTYLWGRVPCMSGQPQT